MSKRANKILSIIAFLMVATVVATLAFQYIARMKQGDTLGEDFSYSKVGYTNVGRYSEKLAPLEIYGQWGFCDNNGKVQIVPQFAKADVFSSGLAAVQGTKEGLYGYIDHSGRYVIEPEYSYAGMFSEGLAAYGKATAAKLGYMNLEGKAIIPEQYYEAGIFSEGLAKVRDSQEDFYYFIDRNGKTVISTQYADASDFFEGLAAVMIDGEWGFIDTKGQMVIAPAFTNVHDFHEGIAAVFQNGTWGYIDQEGNFTIKNIFGEAGDFSGGLAPVLFADSELWGYINNKGETVMNGTYQGATSFSEGVAAVFKDLEWIFVTHNNDTSATKNDKDATKSSDDKEAENSTELETSQETEALEPPTLDPPQVAETISDKNVTDLIREVQVQINETVQLSGIIKTNDIIERLTLRVIGDDGKDKGLYLSIQPGSTTYNLNQVSIDSRIEPFNSIGKYKLQIWAQQKDVTEETKIGEVHVEVLAPQNASNLTLDIGMIDSAAYPVVNVFMSVFQDKKNPITNLTIDNFKLYESIDGHDGTLQKIDLVKQPDADTGVNVALVLDCSLSMYNDDKTEENSNMALAKKAAIDFVNSEGVSAKDMVAIQSFGKAFVVKEDFTSDKNKLIKAINGVTYIPNTAIFDAVLSSVATLDKLQGKKCIIIYTDGADTASKQKYTDSIRLAVKNGIPVYSIAIGQEAKTNELKSISDKTGGAFYYLKDPKELDAIYSDIIDKMKNQYQLTYESTIGTTSDSKRTINVVVTSDTNMTESDKTYELK